MTPARWVILFLLVAARVLPAHGIEFTVSSKKFTESVILGEIMAAVVRYAGMAVTHRRALGGTRVLWGALGNGDIDAYPEYTSTIAREILAGAGRPAGDPAHFRPGAATRLQVRLRQRIHGPGRWLAGTPRALPAAAKGRARPRP